MKRVVKSSAMVVAAGLILAVPLAASAADEPIELIHGGTFDDVGLPWFTTPDLTAVNDDGQLCVDVAGGTPTAWSSIVGVDDVPIVSGKDYDFSFTATGETDVPVVIRALVQQSVSPWNATYEANPAIGGEGTEFSFNFHSTLDIPEAQVVFQIGGANSDWRFCVDNVHLAEGDPAPAFVPETGNRVRVNQVGYLTSGLKRATLMTDATEALPWTLRDAAGATVATGQTDPRGEDSTAGSIVHVIDFSTVDSNGEGYTLEADGDTSYPFEIGPDLYADLRYDSLHYFSLARSGIEITEPGYERPAGHVGVAPNQGDTAVPCQEPEGFMQNWTCDYTLDVTGGWYDAGDHGKYVVNGGIAVAQVMSTYERSLYAPSATAGTYADGTLSVPEGKNGTPDILDEARWELEWMLKMQVPAGYPLEGMVHHKVQDNEWTGLPLLPSEDPKPRELHRPSTAATLNLAAVAAQGSRLFAEFDPEFSATLLDAARIAWSAAEATPELYAPAADGNDGGGPYNDDEVEDEFYWAAAELYLTTGEAQFDDALHANPVHSEDLYTIHGFDWGHVGAVARMELATVPSELSDRDAVIDSVVALADGYLRDQEKTNFGLPYAPKSGYNWGSNGTILNNMIVIATAYDLTGNSQYSAAVVEGMDYLLGRNAMNNSYITGYGTVYSHNMHSRWFAHQLNPKYPEPAPGTISGGPNSRLEDPIAKQTFNKGCAAQQCYLDDIQSYATNEMTVNWNSALVWVSAFVDDQRQLEPASAVSPVDSIPIAPLAIGGGLVVLAAGAALLVRKRRRSSAKTSE